jgi:hypothetical protein
MATLFAICVFGSTHHAWADSDRDTADRIKYLEKRLQTVEEALQKVLANQQQKPTRHAMPTAKPAPRTGVAAAGQTEQPKNLSAADDHAVAPATNASQIASGSGNDAPQELNILRENAVTLKPHGVEISNEVDYGYRSTSLQRDQAITTATVIRYGVLDWLELSASLPLGYTTRTSNVSPFSAVAREVSGLGDISLQANAKVFEQTNKWPGIVLSLGAIIPTGANPYDLGQYNINSTSGLSVPNPRNPLGDYFSQGSFGIHSNLQFYKTVDPLILFFGFGADRVFPYAENGYTIDAFVRFNYNFGFSFALSEKTTLGFSVNGSYQPDLHLNGKDVFQSSSEPTLVRLTVIQRMFKDVYLEPSIAFGLTQDSPDFLIGLGVRARF